MVVDLKIISSNTTPWNSEKVIEDYAVVMD